MLGTLVNTIYPHVAFLGRSAITIGNSWYARLHSDEVLLRILLALARVIALLIIFERWTVDFGNNLEHVLQVQLKSLVHFLGRVDLWPHARDVEPLNPCFQLCVSLFVIMHSFIIKKQKKNSFHQKIISQGVLKLICCKYHRSHHGFW